MNRRQKKKQISKLRKQDAEIWKGLFNYYLETEWGRKGKKWRKRYPWSIRRNHEQAAKEEIKETN